MAGEEDLGTEVVHALSTSQYKTIDSALLSDRVNALDSESTALVNVNFSVQMRL